MVYCLKLHMLFKNKRLKKQTKNELKTSHVKEENYSP